MAGSGGALSRSGLRGRESEIQELHTLIASVARTGSGGLALIQGVPGIGKTTLLAEAVTGAREAGFSVGLGKADELHHIVPLSSLAACVLHGDRPLLSGDAFADLARHHDQRIWLVERLAEAMEARAGSVPVLIALDDVQWADPLSRFALTQLPTRLRTSPVLWMLAGRPEPAGPAEEIVAAATDALPTVTVPVGPLSGAAIGQVAGDTLGTAVDERVRDLLDGAGGNPFLAVEMLAGLRNGRDLVAAREAGETALRAATETGDREAHVLALSGLGEIALNAGENAVALERFAALSAIDSAFLPEEIVAHQHVDDFGSSERLLLRAADHDGSLRQAMMLWAQAQQHLGLGRLDDADAGFLTMERLEEAVQVPVQQVNSRVIRSWIALVRGE
ncbi:AAA family ATPase [Streptomyces sp. NPDC058620]|uniref:ATP-binding protein n=1 Tax=Streptomyces sp. NPDC058620 TaxID=3346560 RepID=UPI00365BD3FE